MSTCSCNHPARRPTISVVLARAGLLVLAVVGGALLCAPAFAGTGSTPFIRGDANADGAVDIGDAITVLAFLFTQGTAPPCADAADANDDGSVDIGDAISILSYLFSGAGKLPPPFPAPGVDPTPADPFVCGDPCLPEEFCNGTDDDCDGSIDEDAVDATAYYPDLDADGYGRAGVMPLLSCEVPPGMVANQEDCDDDDGGVFPGADEFCDGEDDDCDGTPDDSAVDAIAFYPDTDDDGFGAEGVPPVFACAAPAGHVSTRGDCDDTDDTRYPGATELCDGEDEDCDGDTDEDAIDALPFYPDTDDDGHGAMGVAPVFACTAPSGHVAERDDCDDLDPSIHPGATETCDGEDEDCDGTADDSAIDALSFWPDSDGDGFGDEGATAALACTAPPAHVGNDQDCDDADASTHPGAPELCDGGDDDCDGLTDEEPIDGIAFYPDSDDDGFGAAGAPPVFACTAPPAHVTTRDDCDDGDPSIHPSATELCDGEDQDCDGVADDVPLDDVLEAMRPPAAMPRRCQCPTGTYLTSFDDPDIAGTISKLYGATLQVPRQECIATDRDILLPGIGTDFVFERHYRSRRVSVGGPMGNQWEHSYEIRAHLEPDGLHLFDGDHREDVLVLQPDGVTYARDGVPLAAHLSGVDIFVEFGNGGIWRLEPRGGGGGGGGGWRIAEITDLYDNELLFSYDTAGRLGSVLDTVGRVVTFSYDTQGRISTVADGTGRVWSYAYYAAGETGGSPGDLKSVTSPPIVGTPTGNDFPLGRTTTYTYTSGHSDDELNHDLLTITDPRGNVRASYEYDLDPMSPTRDALIAREIGGARWTLSRHCADPATDNGAVLRVIGKDDRGAVTEMFFDALHRCVMRRDYTGFAPDPLATTTATANRPGPPLRPSDPPYFETRYSWNAHHRVTQVVHPDGNTVNPLYESEFNPGTNPLFATNLRQVTRTPGTHPGGGAFPSLVDSFEVQPGFGGFAGHEFRTLHTNPRLVAIGTLRDSNGRPLQVIRPLSGANEDFEWDSRGRMTAHLRMNHTAIALPTGRRRDECTYHASGPGAGQLATSTVDALGIAATTAYAYDLHGDVIQVVHPSGNSESWTRNALGEVVVHLSRTFDTSLHRYETRTYYDANGNVVRTDLENRDADGLLDASNPHLTRIAEYDAFDSVSRLLEEEGIWFVPAGQLDGTGLPASEFVSTELVHDVSGRLLLERSGVATSGAQPAAVVAHEYDERDLLHRSTRAPGTSDSSTSQWAYSRNGLQIEHERFGFGSGPRQTTSIYDGYDRLVSVTDAMGNVRSYEYDENGNVTRSLLHGELADGAGGALNVRMEEEEASYDALDRRISALFHRFDPATQSGSGGRNENWDFTGGGHLLSHTDDSGDVTQYEYDSAERLHTVTDALGNEVELAYDLHSNVLTELHRDLSSVSPGTITLRQWNYAYDGLDRRISSTGPSGETRAWSHAWHGVGRTVDERGNVERSVADSLGRIIRTERDLTSSGTGGTPVIGTAMHHHAYDENGRRVLHTDPNGNETSYEYDALDRLVRTVRADGTEEVVAYDAHDDATTEVDPNGTLRSYTYDALSRRVASSILAAPGVDPSATFETFTYDAAGRVRAAVNDDASVSRSYDSLGYGTSETVDGLTASLATDDEGHETLVTYPSGRQLAYSTDALGRTHQVSEGPAILATILHGPCCLEYMSTSNGITTEYTYDLSRRLVLVSGTHSSGSSIQVDSYAWDPARNLATRNAATGSQISSSYQYDSLDRLVVSQASSPVVPGYFANYQLDTAGNRLFVGGFPFAGPYAMDPTLPAPADAQMHQYTQTPTDQRQYTAAGDLSVVTSFNPAVPPVSYHYDGLGRLRSREEPGTPLTEYHYDALGRRIRALIAGTTSRYVYLFGGQELAVHDGGGAEIESSVYASSTGRSIRIGMRRVGLSGSPEDFFFHHDSAGSIVLLTDASGAVVESYDYGDHGRVTVRDPFHNPLPASQVGNVHLFHGHRLDPSGRVYLIGGGFLDPETGRTSDRLESITFGAIQLDALDPTGGSAPPREYLGGNPTSARQRLLRFEIPERHLTPEQSQTLSRADPPIRDFDRDGYPDIVLVDAIGIPDYLDPDDDGDGVPTIDEGMHFGAVPRSGSLSVNISGVPQPGLMISGGGGGGGGGGGCGGVCDARGVFPGDPIPIIRGSALGTQRFRDDPYAEDTSRARGSYHTTTPGHKYVDSLSLRGAAGSMGKPVRDWIAPSAKGQNIRKNITVTLFKSDKSHGKEGKRYNYFEAWPCRWQSPSLLSTAGADMESVAVKPLRVELK